MKHTNFIYKTFLILAYIIIPKQVFPYIVAYPEFAVNGIHYFGYWDISNRIEGIDDYLTFISYGFTLNPDDHNTCITPDDKIIPKLYMAYVAVAPNKRNNWTDYSNEYEYYKYYKPYKTYTGNKYIVDNQYYMSVNGDEYVKESGCFILDIDSKTMSEGLISLRTPIYYTSPSLAFEYATDLQKIQYGGCHSIDCFTFFKNTKLKTVILEQAPYIEYYAFAGCHNIDTIILLSEEDLPLLEAESAFEDDVYKNAMLYVADNLLQQAEKHPIWNKFENIRSLRECPAGLIMEYKYVEGYEEEVD